MSDKQPVSPKVILSGGNIKIAYDQQTAVTNLLTGSYFPAMVTGGWGDPHMYLRLKGTNKFLCRWGDNKSGASGKNEILYLYIRTKTDTISIYYTNSDFGSAKITTNIRVVHNNQTFNFSNSAVQIFGPVRLVVRRLPWGQNYYLNYDVDWDPIANLRQIGGALGVALRRSAASNGAYVNGLDGPTWDGYSYLGQPFGLSRTDFESGFEGQSAKAMNVIPGSFNFATIINSTPILSDVMTDLFDGINNDTDLATDVTDEENNDEDVTIWDGLAEAAITAFASQGSIFNQLAYDVVNNSTTIQGMSAAFASAVVTALEANTDPNNRDIITTNQPNDVAICEIPDTGINDNGSGSGPSSQSIHKYTVIP